MSSNEPISVEIDRNLRLAPTNYSASQSIRNLAPQNSVSSQQFSPHSERGSNRQFRIGTTVVHTLRTSAHHNNNNNASVNYPLNNNTNTNYGAGRSNQPQVFHAFSRPNNHDGNSGEMKLFSGKGNRVGGENCGTSRQRKNTILVSNSSTTTSLSSENARNSGTTNSTNMENQTEFLVECEKCKMWISHRLLDDHMAAHYWQEVVSDDEENESSVAIGSSSSIVPDSSFSRRAEPAANGGENRNELRRANRETEEVETVERNSQDIRTNDNEEFEPLNVPNWKGLVRRRNALWPFMRFNTSRSVSTQESTGVETSSNETDFTEERNGTDSSGSNEEITTESYSLEGGRVRNSNNINATNNVDYNNNNHSVRTTLIPYRSSSLNITNFYSSANRTNIYPYRSNSINIHNNGINICNNGSNIIINNNEVSINNNININNNRYQFNRSIASAYRNAYDGAAAAINIRNMHEAYRNSVSLGSQSGNHRRHHPLFVDRHRHINIGGRFLQVSHISPSSFITEEFSENTRPLSEQEISQLPTSTFDSSLSSSLIGNSKTCVICLEEYVTGDKQRRLPCTHVYHKECIDGWLKKSRLCPVCKHSICQD